MAGNLKIISGKYKGLTFDGDSIIGTRPTMNRVKESLFAMIQTRLKDKADAVAAVVATPAATLSPI